MRDEINQNISRLVDDDLGYDETLDLLGKIKKDDSLMAKMARYQAISHVLKNEEYLHISSDFSAKVFQEIQREPNYLLPQRKRPTTDTKKIFAIAASVLLAAVLVGHNLQDPTSPLNNSPTVTASIATQQALPDTLAQNQNENSRHRRPLTAQFNEYLQAHNSSVYTNGEANFHPYAKMAAYGKE